VRIGFGLWAALLLAACSSREQGRSSPVTPTKVGALPAYESPASWRYHPHVVAPMRTRAELVPGRVLFAGARGERWLLDVAAGRLESAVPAPEDLVAILSGPSSGYSFVGRSGATYRSDDPLGRFVSTTAPFEPLAEVAGANRVLLAVRRDRRLVRSVDAGASFGEVGPRDVAFADVEMDTLGNALALAFPESLYRSGDGGATFQRLEAPTRGAVGLERDLVTGSIRVLTVLGPLVFAPSGALAPAPPAPAEAVPKGIRPLAGPNAGAFAEGRATWAGSGYVEARSVDSRIGTWALLSGPLKGPLVARPLGEAKGCRAVRLAGYERYLRLACFRGSPELTQEIELLASSDAGASFAREKPDVYARLGEFRMAVGAGGAWLVTGACPPSTQSPGCAPSGILHPRPASRGALASADADADAGVKAPARTRWELAVSAAPGLSDSALSLSFGADGKSAFAAARTTKGAGLALYASTDGGKSFEPRELGGRFDSGDESAGRVTLSPAADGTLALVAVRGSNAALFVADDQGRVISASAPPESALVGAAGLSAIAVTADGRVFESLDGGAGWEPAGNLPAVLCDDSGCDVPIGCSTFGCVVGDELTRVGWGTSDLPEVGPFRSPTRATRASSASRLKTPLACALAPGPFRPLPGASELPGASQAALGDAAWFALGVEAATASATLYQARGGPRPRVDAVTLLGPLPDAGRYALAVMDQIEGGAALRYALPEMRAGARLRDVEVAWQNLFERRLVRARVADGGEYFPGDFTRVDRRNVAHTAEPDLMSIGERGLYLRLHASPTKQTVAGSRQPTLFLDGKSVQSLPPIVYPPGVVQGGIDEMAHVGDAHVSLYYVRPGLAVVRGSLDKAAVWGFDAVTIGMPNPQAFGLEQVVRTTYVQGRAAFHLEWVDPATQAAEARAFPLRSAGALVDAPLAVPTLRDLADRPAPCTAAARDGTPRVIARALPGTRHPVIVSDPIDPPRAMVTGDAVLHGTPETPCAAAFEVDAVRTGAERLADERGIVPLDDLEHAWLLRRVGSEEGGAPRVEYRSMSCRFEPGLEIPEELLGEPSVSDADR
jgi:hypothetical protein